MIVGENVPPLLRESFPNCPLLNSSRNRRTLFPGAARAPWNWSELPGKEIQPEFAWPGVPLDSIGRLRDIDDHDRQGNRVRHRDEGLVELPGEIEDLEASEGAGRRGMA